MDAKKNKERLGWLLFLQLTLLLYATTSIFSKNAARYPFLSVKFILFYAGMIGVLGLYAILWQQVIKHLPLTLAFANKAINVVWGVVFGMAFFRETITPVQALGCLVIVVGTVLYVKADEAEARDGQ